MLETTCTLTSMKKRLTLEVGWLYMYTDTEPAATRITIAMETPASKATGCCSALSPAVSSSSAAQTQRRALSSTYTLAHTVPLQPPPPVRKNTQNKRG